MPETLSRKVQSLPRTAAGEPFDFLIERCRVLDGTGARSFVGDIALKGSRIADVGDLRAGIADTRIPAHDLVLSPGFIDSHVHSEFHLLSEPTSPAILRQGVTTHIVGQDGFGFAPTTSETFAYMVDYLAGIYGRDVVLAAGGVLDFLRQYDRLVAANVATLIPHGCVRMNVMGNSDRAPTQSELNEMKAICRTAMAEGAIGISTGLDYIPSGYASSDELVELCSAVAPFGGIYVTHLRYRMGLRASLEEALEIGRLARVPVHVSHLMADFEADIWSDDILRCLAAGQLVGVDATFDAYPYEYGCTTLVYLLPFWVLDGSSRDVLARLREEPVRARLRVELEPTLSTWSNVQLGGRLSPPFTDYVGLDLLRVARMCDVDPVDFVCDLLLHEQLDVFVIGVQPTDPRVARDLDVMLRHQGHMLGSDGIFKPGLIHPRAHASFSRFFGRVLSGGNLDLEEAVRHVTSAPANRFGILDRGIVRPGFRADLALFDLESFGDAGSDTLAVSPKQGMRYVFVNGIPVLFDGRITGETPGQGLRRSSSKSRPSGPSPEPGR